MSIIFLESRRRAAERRALRRDYETGVVEGRHPEHVTLHPLYPYQREGMLHLAFGERALLADEMGLGKTIQAVAACALLHHLGKAKRVLVVTPASLKAEWEEQIRRFTTLPTDRLRPAQRAPEILRRSVAAVLHHRQLRAGRHRHPRHQHPPPPDIVVLDEAQRIKNWATKTAQAVKRLQSRYAFVLTGTPIENRIDELYSIVDFLDPKSLLGPLFRFNREFYQFDEKGRPGLQKPPRPARAGETRAAPPPQARGRNRTARPHRPQPLRQTHPGHAAEYDEYKQSVPNSSRNRCAPAHQEGAGPAHDPARHHAHDLRLALHHQNHDCQDCPKLDELARVLDEALADPDVKVIVFSEWEGMLKKVRDWADRNGIGYAWHTGSVPQQKRRGEILAFRNDPACRLFLSTDSGGVGLNLQNASVVINCDLPWNPAKLEQRIARAWRKHQTRPVTVINLIAENTIEHAMLETLANKMSLAEGVLDGSDESLAKPNSNAAATPTSPASNNSSASRRPASPPIANPTRRSRPRLCRTRPRPWEDPSSTARKPCSPARPRRCFSPSCATPPAPPPLPSSSRKPTGAATRRTPRARRIHLARHPATRRSRPHHPQHPRHPPPHRRHPASAPKPVLTAEQLQRIADLRAFAAKKQKVARLLIDSDLAEEAEPHQKAADKALKEAETGTSRMPFLRVEQS
jgi:superfamily II DNA/RNA helicase